MASGSAIRGSYDECSSSEGSTSRRVLHVLASLRMSSCHAARLLQEGDPIGFDDALRCGAFPNPVDEREAVA